MKVFNILFLLLWIKGATLAQVISSLPIFPVAQDSVEVIFDANEGTKGLSGYSGDVYVHTGVITEDSSSPTDWRYVKTNWGENTPETKLTRVDGDLYQLLITPNIRDYYGVPDTEKIIKMAFVFRSTDSALEGKGDGGSDIYIDLNEGFMLEVIQPKTAYAFYAPSDLIDIEFITSESAHISYYVDGALQFEMDTNAYTLQHTVIADQ